MARKIVKAVAPGFSLALPHAQVSSTCHCCHAISWERHCMSSAGGQFSRSVCCVQTRDQPERDIIRSYVYRKTMTEKHWRELFSDPSQWWDHRSEKVNPRYPDFKHKSTGQSLWLDNRFTPPWVEAELVTIAPGVVQSDNFAWNVRLRRHLQAKHYQKTLDLFQQLQLEGVIPDKFTFVPVLNACSKLRCLEHGRSVHEQIIQRGCESDTYVATCLVDMYAKCGNIEGAWSVFNKIRERNVVSWNAMIVGYAKSEQGRKVLELFRKMQQEGVEPDVITFVGVLSSCASVAALEEGRRVHEQIIRKGWESDVYVATCLIDMYAKCGSIENARDVFNRMRKGNVVCCNAMIGGYVKSKLGLKALELFRKMQQEGVKPDSITFIGALNACASEAALGEGKHVHEQIIQRGCESDMYVANSLVDMYAKCGSIEDAWSVFNKLQERSVVSWNAMIGGYVKSGQGLKALELFWKMQEESVEPNTVTFAGVLNACASVETLEDGRRVHEQIIQRGCQSDLYVATCLVDMYAKCGSIEDAWNVFNKIREHDIVSWSAMIMGFVKSKQALKALELFWKMQQEGMEPGAITFVGALNACAILAALDEGRSVHKLIIQRKCQSDVYVATCLVDMYVKCGSIDDASGVFNNMHERDVASWSAMIEGYARHGHPYKAIGLFKRMGKQCVETTEITFTCLLSACSHGGLVKEGLRYFNTMTSGYNVLPTKEHYACMVDLLGRAGWLEEAEEMTKTMPIERDSCVWMSLLGACKIHGDIDVATRAAKMFWEMDPGNYSAHVLLSNIYTAAGKLDRSAAIVKRG